MGYLHNGMNIRGKNPAKMRLYAILAKWDIDSSMSKRRNPLQYKGLRGHNG